MSVLLMLIPISLLFVAAGAVAFFWAVNNDQFDDMDTPGLLPLADSDLVAGADPVTGQPGEPTAVPRIAAEDEPVRRVA